jgi:hypothetical protein
MGQRGPLTSPTSQRGRRKLAGKVIEIPCERPTPPIWLSGEDQKLFNQLVSEAIESKTPIRRIDGHTYAMVAKLMNQARLETDGDRLSRIMRTLLPWMQAAGLNAMGRARLGVPNEKEKPKSDGLDEALFG